MVVDENERADKITLRLEGRKAVRGVVLSDFENFIDSFLAALRDFDRDSRGEQTKKSGHPEGRAARVTAFRLVDFKPGSGIATIEPELGEAEGEIEKIVATEPLQVANLRGLLSQVDREDALPDAVIESLEKACRVFGDDGSIAVELSAGAATGNGPSVLNTLIDTDKLQRIRTAKGAPAPVQVETISGRLHRVDFEPDKLAIRTTDGVDWACEYSASLEPQIERLVNRIVSANGAGVLQSPHRGSMRLERIEGVEQGVQADLFSVELIPADQLAADQGIDGPQGLDAFGVEEWTEEDDAYLEALAEL